MLSKCNTNKQQTCLEEKKVSRAEKALVMGFCPGKGILGRESFTGTSILGREISVLESTLARAISAREEFPGKRYLCQGKVSLTEKSSLGKVSQAKESLPGKSKSISPWAKYSAQREIYPEKFSLAKIYSTRKSKRNLCRKKLPEQSNMCPRKLPLAEKSLPWISSEINL